MLKRTIGSCLLVLLTSAPSLARNCTEASYYDLHGSTTANGETFSSWSYTAAHPYYRFGTRLLVTNRRNGKSVVVRVNDRGPFVAGRGIDMSLGAFARIESLNKGTAYVCYTRL